MRALRAADVILFDDLVSDEGVEFARRETKRILALAAAGRRVVRLKSGGANPHRRGRLFDLARDSMGEHAGAPMIQRARAAL